MTNLQHKGNQLQHSMQKYRNAVEVVKRETNHEHPVVFSGSKFQKLTNLTSYALDAMLDLKLVGRTSPVKLGERIEYRWAWNHKAITDEMIVELISFVRKRYNDHKATSRAVQKSEAKTNQVKAKPEEPQVSTPVKVAPKVQEPQRAAPTHAGTVFSIDHLAWMREYKFKSPIIVKLGNNRELHNVSCIRFDKDGSKLTLSFCVNAMIESEGKIQDEILVCTIAFKDKSIALTDPNKDFIVVQEVEN